MKTRVIEVTKPIFEKKTANQIIFSCCRKNGGSAIPETDLKFAKLCARLANVQKKNRKIIFKVLTAISCSLKALRRFS